MHFLLNLDSYLRCSVGVCGVGKAGCQTVFASPVPLKICFLFDGVFKFGDCFVS